MITLNSIRTALSAANPYSELDRLIRKEMNAGRRVAEIVSEVQPLVDPVLDIPGLTEDGEEAFLGTLDALMGNCRRDQCYFDALTEVPATPSLPVVPVSIR